jgi:hypothetical protein
MYDDRKEYYDFLAESNFTLFSEPHNYGGYAEKVLNQELDWDDIAQTYEKEKVVVVDNFLRPDIAHRLRNYMLYLNVRQDTYRDYAAVNFYRRTGSLWFPLLTNIVDECKDKFSFLEGHEFIRAWSFIYDNESEGVRPHADPAAVNFNLWVTDNSSMIDAEGQNGLDVWKIYPPSDWAWETYNRDNEAIANFLTSNSPEKMSIEYKFNRVTIFDSQFFHSSQPVRTKTGYRNRRINYTFLFGEEQNAGY